jgi:NADH-quinone oxidoreductase subunit M
VGIMLLPEGAKFHMPWIICLTLVNVVYGAFIASVQTDLKYVIGFSSVSHMGLVSMGFATLNKTGMLGAGIQMFSHGIMTALFFAVVGMVYDQAHTREIPKLGGFRKVMPLVTLAFIVGGLVSMGMPGFSGFIAEFPIFMGLWKATPANTWANYAWIAIIAAISIVVTASYIIRIIGKVFFGK